VAVYARQKTDRRSVSRHGSRAHIFEAAATGQLERVRELLKKKNPELIHRVLAGRWTPLHLNFGNVDDRQAAHR